jgi:hypothetical protein
MEPKPESLTTVYQEVCKGHAAIADFRAKLLALLPIASAGAIGLLFKGHIDPSLLVAIGVFGVVVTFGLFLYELRGVQDCVLLRGRAAALEEKMDIPVEMSQFRGRKRGMLGGLVDEIGAGLVVYPAVMAAWAFVATHAADFDDRVAGATIAVIYLAVVSVGVKVFMQADESDAPSPEATPAESAEPYSLA